MENKQSKYLKYAIGEIILVVIGILIALQINNWNEHRKVTNQLLSIYDRILLDIENDISEMSRNRDFYKQKQFLFDKVNNDSITRELLDEGLSRMIFTSASTNFNLTGVQQLKEQSDKDSLSLRIIEAYDLMQHVTITPIEKIINDEMWAYVIYIRDHYDWYSEWNNKRINKDNSSKELQDYFISNIEYKNHVVFNYQVMFNNYVPNLESSIAILETIKNELKNKLDKG